MGKISKQEAYNILLGWVAGEVMDESATHIPKNLKVGKIREVLDALRPPTPDKETRLVPCGCGAQPAWEEVIDEDGLLKSRLYCPKSKLTTRWHNGLGETADDWNWAMGCPPDID